MKHFEDDLDTTPGIVHRAAGATRYLHAGQLIAERGPCAVSTILGSCVSVCLHDPVAGVGGINHYLLPHPVGQERSARFGYIAVPRLVEEVLALGARRSRLQAKVFGGSNPLHLVAPFPTGDLGLRNVELALKLLDELRIPILAQDVGGPLGRKVIFHTDDGTAWVRKL